MWCTNAVHGSIGGLRDEIMSRQTCGHATSGVAVLKHSMHGLCVSRLVSVAAIILSVPCGERSGAVLAPRLAAVSAAVLPVLVAIDLNP